ncbi:MAG TPA: CDP-diacylglycerol--serine O-phosphatidyltransferase [Pirellulales bacterium]|jgi:CDP-diacylglycerol--serine O-phosphatidyltransferase|nr:CDP-diacylglycerol--serine O-phosphatidyltransferase [Pirellulales bacterium]
MSKLRTVAILPTLFTLGNLACGFFAIVVAARVDKPTSAETPTAAAIQSGSPVHMVQGLLKTADPVQNCMLAGWLIFLAMIFDALDGHVARLTNVTSDFGAQLDSLCDVVTFGVAPAFLLVKICPEFTFHHSYWVWLIAASFAACAAIRLARFNAETHEDDDHMNFSGLPSPAAAASIASFAILFYTLRREDNQLVYAKSIDDAIQMILPWFAVLVAAAMVSRVPYPHIVNQLLKGQRSFGHLVSLIFAILAVMVVRGYAIPIVCVGFVLSGPVLYLWQEAVERRPHKEPMF